MNLKDLIAKMTAIEEGVTPPLAPEHTDGAGAGDSYNNDVEECGMPVAIGGPAPQDNHVTMNISMNGTGSDGVRNLMNILKDIENGETKPHMGHEHEPEAPLMGSMVRAMGQEEDVGEEYENSMYGHDGTTEFGMDAITQTGDDLASQGKGALKHNGGENPMHESLVNRLSQMYAAIKEERTEEKDEKGNVVRWKEEGEWTKKSGKEGRGKVTNLSDKARRESEKLSKKEKEVAEGGITLGANGQVDPNGFTPEKQMALNKMVGDKATQKDLGDGFTAVQLDMFGGVPAVLDTQSNTYILPNRRADGSAIVRSPGQYIFVSDGKTTTGMKVGPATAAALQKAGLENSASTPAGGNPQQPSPQQAQPAAGQTEFVPHDYQTKEPLQKGQDGKWRNSKGEERDGFHGGPMNPGVNGGPSTAQFRSLVPLAPKENIELAEMLKIAGLR